MRKITLLIMVLLLSGCTTAGPFVSNISSDGKGGLNIEKSRVKLNYWTNGLETCETTNANIQLSQPIQYNKGE